MNNSIVEKYSKEELNLIVSESFSKAELMRKLGYKSSYGRPWEVVKIRLNQLNICFTHFTDKTTEKRDSENIFIENSTACQSVLRRYYLKMDCIEYKCSICGQEPFWNGKKLTLTLDHINGKNKDNRLENLRWVCPNCDRQLPTYGSKNKEKKKYICLDCGKEINRSSVRCVECNNKNKIKINKKISREELKIKIRKITFVEIAKEFSVSDAAIRKWCDFYHLPRTKKEINSYSENEWELI